MSNEKSWDAPSFADEVEWAERDVELCEEVRRIGVEHMAERDRMLAGRKIRADDPDFEEKARALRVDIHIQNKLQAAVGDDPETGFIQPPPEHDPAPKATIDFVRETKKKRATKLP